MVTVTYYPESREYNGKWYTECKGMTVQPLVPPQNYLHNPYPQQPAAPVAPMPTAAAAPVQPTQPTQQMPQQDDLPF